MDDRERTYLSRDARHAQLLTVGLQLFSTRGYDDISIDDIAREAGISKGLLYHYFGGKRELYVAVVQHAAGALLEALRPDPARSGVDNVRDGLTAYLRFVAERAEAFLALQGGSPAGGPEVQAILEQSREAIAAQILLSAGVDAALPPYRVAARAWLGGVEAASVDWLRHRDMEEAELVELLSATLFVCLLSAACQAPGTAPATLLAGLPLLGGLTRRRA